MITDVSTIRSSRWHRFFAAWHPTELAVSDDGLQWRKPDGATDTLAFTEVTAPPLLRKGLLWSALEIGHSEGARLFHGLRKTDGPTALAQLMQHWETFNERVIAARRSLLMEWDQQCSSHRWVRHSWARQWRQNAASFGPSLLTPPPINATPRAIAEFDRFRSLFKQTEEHRARANAAYLEFALARYERFFDTVEAKPLSPAQRIACIRDEDSNLVLAGAGSGKTSVIAARAGFLVASGQARPEQILILAFNRKAADEVSARLRSRQPALSEVTVATFHGLSLRVGYPGRTKPAVSRLALEDAHLPVFVLETLRTIAEQPGSPAERSLRRFLERDLTTDARDRDSDAGDLLDAPMASGATLRHAVQRASMAGMALATADHRHLVRSQQEGQIANYLFMNGIEYEYEPDYEVPTATFEHRQYRPDFYLPDFGIYLEHFAMRERDDPCPPSIDPEAYLAGVEWKRALHTKHGTRLIETCSADARSRGGLLGALEQRLLAEGVQLAPRPLAPIFDNLRWEDRFDPRVSFIRLLARFVTTAKTSLRTGQDLREAAQAAGDRHRAFLEVAELVSAAHEKELRAKGEVDFSDMLADATQATRSGAYRPRFTHILVDEFQDLSAARAGLIMALRTAGPRPSIFCVGDDWQSIYAFTGSDISWTTQFGARFGAHVVTSLDRTFRFDQRTADIARSFVIRNHTQTDKTVLAARGGTNSSISLVYGDKEPLAATVERLIEFDGLATAKGTALILSRYTATREDQAALARLRRNLPNLRWEFSTIHQAKGREADYVFLTGLNGGARGFPSTTEDDPVLDLVLPQPDSFPYGEERRLMYVAMTRARLQTWLIGTRTHPSPFMTELLERERGRLRVLAFGDKAITEGARTPTQCPACAGGVIIEQRGRFGAFFACSSSPFCQARFARCPGCDAAPFLPVGDQFRCTDTDCGQRAPACPDCRRMQLPRWTGFLVLKNGRNGRFRGCHNWRPQQGGCGTTRQISA